MHCLFVFGPTASGKSELALRIAEILGGEIINCDSVSVYHGLDIGAAKPSASDFARCPHHLFSHVHYPQLYTAAEYRRDALEILAAMDKRGVKLAIVVGGTGFYFRALERGLPDLLELSSEEKQGIREQVEANPAAAYRALQSLDPEYADKISVKDLYRLTRAKEILHLGRIPSREFALRAIEFPYPVKKIFVCPERQVLRQRVSQRCQKMLAAGWLDEVKQLLAAGRGDWRALQAVGYREIVDFLQQQKPSSLAELQTLIETKTMQLAKRQRTWFAKEPAHCIVDTNMDWRPLLEAWLGN